MSPLVQQATDLNSTGVKLLEERNFEDAAKAMTQSIKLIRKELSITRDDTSKEMSSPSDGNLSAEIELVKLSPVADRGESDEQDISFNQAITISFRDDDHVASEEDLQLYSAAIIYNLAICHHHQAIQCSFQVEGGVDVTARKSEKLYETVLTLLSSSSRWNRACVIIQLACCNNLAQLRFRFGDNERARECLSAASSHLLIALVTSQQSNEASVVLDEPMVQGLLLNNFFLRTPPQLAAAA